MTTTQTKTATWLGIALCGVLALWFWNSPVLWPVKILVVLFHELGHACAAWLTGGQVVEIGLSPQQGGHARTRGGLRLVILNAGYLGSLLWGVGLLAASRRKQSARAVLGLLGAVVVVVTVVYVRPIVDFGFGFGVLMGAVLLVGARFLPLSAAQVLLRGLGVFSILYALFDVRDDVFLAGPGAISDATMLADVTGVPAVFWGVLWLALWLGVLWATRRWVA